MAKVSVLRVELYDRKVGSEVIRASWILTTALSLGAAVSKANATVSNAHKSDHCQNSNKEVGRHVILNLKQNSCKLSPVKHFNYMPTKFSFN